MLTCCNKRNTMVTRYEGDFWRFGSKKRAEAIQRHRNANTLLRNYQREPLLPIIYRVGWKKKREKKGKKYVIASRAKRFILAKLSECYKFSI